MKAKILTQFIVVTTISLTALHTAHASDVFSAQLSSPRAGPFADLQRLSANGLRHQREHQLSGDVSACMATMGTAMTGSSERAPCKKPSMAWYKRVLCPRHLIMPDANTNWYVDLREKMETAFVNDPMPHVEKTYRTIEEREGRVMGGLSMGGYGALRFALKYPEKFQAAALLSPAIYNPEPPADSSARMYQGLLNPIRMARTARPSGSSTTIPR